MYSLRFFLTVTLHFGGEQRELYKKQGSTIKECFVLENVKETLK